MEKLFKLAAARGRREGGGYWLAPHLWLCESLTREDGRDEDPQEPAMLGERIGPPYHRVFGRHTRHYAFKLLRALQVDLFFVEDGVTFRSLRRVWRQLFEIYDKSAGQQRAEEHHFQGLPKVRVLLHHFQGEDQFRSSLYPEPRFADFGRLRILHVFRDRGDQEELSETPMDHSYTPAPLLV